ncbi:FUSC family protein [Pseudochelatococcus contaminans]|uniref:Putative membrane protein YccC n=1 Tax=Pseudochelatococcus contaminans TaxID=1538103 RepID=A0A7W5Z4P9_9HYPH|nr:FUSC family protein [Pseudochelatococcus contaminans]MBB3810013.1 putative membrane protein YccC [Pseudochelatococcus contaminans]
MPQGRQAAAVVRSLARSLELRSVGLAPEYFNRTEGYRAALAVAVPLALAVATGHPELSWAVFAAFWTCLCDSPAPDRLRRKLLGGFVVFGTAMAFLGSWAASFGAVEGMTTGPLLVFVAILASSAVAYGAMTGTLLAVVGVVAIGFPLPLERAALQAAAFFCGALWTYLLINFIWRMDEATPLHQTADSVVNRLADMASDLVSLAKNPDAGHDNAEHRRTVRLALERLRGLLARYAGEPAAVTGRYLRLLDAAETIFSALIALDHAFIHRQGPAHERLIVARSLRTALLGVRLVLDDSKSRDATLRWGMERLRGTRSRLTDDMMIGCLIALEEAMLVLLERKPPLEQLAPLPPVSLRVVWQRLKGGLRQALRQSAGVVAVYYAAHVFNLGYPYWATMAVIVVLQGSARITWIRCLERIFGSLLGGAVALGLLQFVSSEIALSVISVVLAATAIALRTVNYTIFVIFLTMLFILVTEMLQPGVGIASARMLDNLVGSLAALSSVLVLWPEFGPALQRRIEAGLEANRAYADRVRAEASAPEVHKSRRAAGLASSEAEIAHHDLTRLLHRRHRLSLKDAAALQDLRNLAGEGAAGWHRLLAVRDRDHHQADETSRG